MPGIQSWDRDAHSDGSGAATHRQQLMLDPGVNQLACRRHACIFQLQELNPRPVALSRARFIGSRIHNYLLVVIAYAR